MASTESQCTDGGWAVGAGTATDEVVYIVIDQCEPFAHVLSRIKLNRFYSAMQWLHTSAHSNDDADDELIGVQFQSKSFDILKLCMDHNNEMDMVVQRIIVTEHTLNGFQICVDKESFLTFGIDGQVFVWDATTMDVVSSLVTHSKHGGGVKQAIYNKRGKTLQSIGHNGNFIVYAPAAAAADANDDVDTIQSWHIQWHDIHMRCIPESHLITHNDTNANRLATSTHSWKSTEMQKSSSAEVEKSITELANVVGELNRIKANVKELLDANDSIKSLDVKLPTKAFNVNKCGTERLCKAKEMERDAQRQQRIQFHQYQQEILAYVKQCTWDQLRTKPTKIRRIGATTTTACDTSHSHSGAFIENYVMTELDERLANDIEQILQMPEIIVAINAYRPWQLKTFCRKCVEMPAQRAHTIKSKQFERFANVASKIIERNLKARATNSHLFITPLATETDQIDIENSQQVFEHNVRAYVSIYYTTSHSTYYLLNVSLSFHLPDVSVPI